MTSRVQKWGNSLAVRIPRAFALEAGLCANGIVEISLIDGAVVMQPVNPAISLEELLRGVTDENKPGEWPTGAPVGKETL